MIGREDLICASDAEAIELATKFTDKHEVEVWHGDRFVTKLARQKPSMNNLRPSSYKEDAQG
ncbi:hypothetical protein [Bradyrhizobium elkanii]|jgi:hypothetical protein|uniref:hypothetical protein n=1 Tax=Bradyrhizobium elkanii TaxID=29448 RepID=UPI0020A0AE47|nr:hypothetical protein [Bradyrhizobium elkanii]MCP1972892.1 hypothetical protein [Bradyrhizobium elkanii]MCS3520089.1 hypothetical protein [Bradyrhizobium elkanii]MCS4067744.1 hypothetical protein [Bradyrhizobium elkanii]MCS4083280.1 hypothetical protein [Bradyrhizobium elkanii]MCS4105600.1 hypothetical protein [Bradyrhizobium elkanii]